MAASIKSYDFLDPPSRSGDLGMLGHYCVMSELGRGGMGYVFRAEDIKLKRAVALKVMNQKIAATPNSRRRFIHEARAMAAVHHDNVATIFEVGESKGIPFMAMEMLKGSTIETFNKSETRLGYEQIIEYAKQIARGLSAAHTKGIVHRDIKPANIWIEEGTDRIKILDFGLALASTPVDHLAGRGAVIGTPGYLSPEQARSEPLDDRSDLYSLGVVLYELCTGQLPIQSNSVPGQLISILAHRPKPINEINPDIPNPLCEMIHRMLRKEPRSRPSSAAKLQEELQRVEVECHAKSEVAQAINKLQMGLTEVVSKKESDSFFDTVEEIQETIPDPLAVIAAPVTMMPPARPAARNAPTATGPAWKSYWPYAAIGAVVLIALPVLTYAFSGRGRGTDSHVVADASPSADNGSTDQANPSSTNEQPKPPAQDQTQSQANKQPNNNQANSGRNKKNQRNKNGGNQNQQNRNAGQQKTAVSKNEPQNVVPVSKGPDLASVQGTKPSTPSEPPPTEPKPTEPRQPEPKPEPAPTIEMKWVTITTGDGHGADAMVKKGAGQKLGQKLSFGIRETRGIETNHAYLRFDLAAIEDVKSHVKSAELVLTVVSSKRPVGTKIRVLGIADAGLWPEHIIEWNFSPSGLTGLGSFPLLGEVTVSGDGDAGKNTVRISGPELAKFIASSGDSVTLVLAGAGKANELVLFVAREQSVEQAPKLIIEVPKVAPQEDKKKKR